MHTTVTYQDPRAVRAFLRARAMGTGVMAGTGCPACYASAVDAARAGTCGYMYINDCARDLHAAHLAREGYSYTLHGDDLTLNGETVEVVAR